MHIYQCSSDIIEPVQRDIVSRPFRVCPLGELVGEHCLCFVEWVFVVCCVCVEWCGERCGGSLFLHSEIEPTLTLALNWH